MVPLRENLLMLKEQFNCHIRNAISWPKKFELDVWYVGHISFMTDCKVILTTIKKVLGREDISSATSATMEAFNGHI